MEFATKTEERFPATEIRPLTNAEIDYVEGGVYHGLGRVAAAVVNLVARLTGTVT